MCNYHQYNKHGRPLQQHAISLKSRVGEIELITRRTKLTHCAINYKYGNIIYICFCIFAELYP